MAFDFSTGCGSDYKALVGYLQNKQIGILVNNVGGISDYPDVSLYIPTKKSKSFPRFFTNQLTMSLNLEPK